MTSVAAIIPTRDRAALTERAVASVLAQTRAPDELIVIDDGSRDGTAERLRDAFPRVALLRLDGRGVSAARNRGIRAASSEWLAFLDSDDEWLPEKIERQLAALAAEPEHPVCHTDEIWIRDGRRVNPRRRHAKRGGHIFRHCLPLCAISPSSAMVHRSVFERVGTFDESLLACEDYDLWLRVCSRWPVLFVDRPLVRKYGGHADQLSRTAALDRYRIRALTKILETGELEAADRDAALATLDRKIEVYAGGARKRGRVEEVRELERLQRRFAAQPVGAA
ncbi:MAG: glycosyltransferase [bacterium]|nr:glycosyltransferase [bacterium]